MLPKYTTQSTFSKLKIKTTNFKLKIYAKLKRLTRTTIRTFLIRLVKRAVIFLYYKYLLNSTHWIQNNQLIVLTRKNKKLPYPTTQFNAMRQIGFASKRRSTFYFTTTTQTNFSKALSLQYVQ